MQKLKSGFFKVLCVCLPIIAILGLLYLFVYAIGNCVYYNKALQAPLYVDAQISAHRQEEDSDGDLVYVAYVSYTAADQFFQDIRYDTDHKQDGLDPIGTHVRLTVDSANPGKVLNRSGFALMACTFGAILCVIAAFSQKELRRRKLSQGLRGIVETDVLENDLHIIIQGRACRVLWPMLAVLFAGLRLAFPLLTGKGYLIATAAVGVFWVISMVNTVIADYKVRHGLYQVCIDTLVSKEESSDTDGHTTYTLYFCSDKNKWQKNVSATKYQNAFVGSAVQAVYLQGCRSPIMHYDSQGNAAD